MKSTDLAERVRPAGSVAPELTLDTKGDGGAAIAMQLGLPEGNPEIPRMQLPGEEMDPRAAEGITYGKTGRKLGSTAEQTPAERGFPAQGEPTKKPEKPDGFYLYKGFGGIPFRSRSGTPPNIKQNDPAHLQPELVGDAQVRIFDLSKPDDLQEYTRVWDMMTKKLYKFSAEEKQWVAAKETWLVFLRYAILYYQIPEV